VSAPSYDDVDDRVLAAGEYEIQRVDRARYPHFRGVADRPMYRYAIRLAGGRCFLMGSIRYWSTRQAAEAAIAQYLEHRRELGAPYYVEASA